MINLQIIPDRRVENSEVENLLRTLAGMYQTPIARKFAIPERASWEMIMGKEQADFFLVVPKSWAPVVKKQVAVVWPRATVKESPDPLQGIKPKETARLELKQHFMFSIRVDRRTLGVLPSVLETVKMLDQEEKIAVQVLLDPAPPDWWQSAAAAYEAYRKGKMPQRLNLSLNGLGMAGLKALTYTTLEVVYIMQELLTGEEPERYDLNAGDKVAVLRERPIGYSVASKLREDAFDVTIRIAVQSKNAKTLLRSIWYGFRSMDADNSFSLVNSNCWEKMITREPGLKINKDYLSIREVEMLMQLPTRTLQEEYKINSVAFRETDVPKIVTEGGLLLGEITSHGHVQHVYMPTKDHDELCLPHVCIGGMGTGKTKGFGANLAVEAVQKGMGAIIIDPAKGEIGDELETVLKPEQQVRIRFGTQPVALDWREALHSEKARNRLANELVAFCEAASEEAGAQTVRYLRAAAKAVPNGRLSELVNLLTDSEYRESLIPRMRAAEGMTWMQFGELSDARQAQIAMPVLNRLDVITGDDYLAECLNTEKGIDLVQLLDQPRAIVIDIPKAELGTEGVNILASLMATKIDLAMVLRKSKHPVFIIQDEPHQYQKSARTWHSAAVESRKWRFCYVWMFHAWEQLPRDVAAIIQAAGPHYHLYTSSKATYRALAEEIRPFEVEEAMATPRHWAINVIRAGGVTVKPFLAKMTPPPSMGYNNWDKQKNLEA